MCSYVTQSAKTCSKSANNVRTTFSERCSNVIFLTLNRFLPAGYFSDFEQIFADWAESGKYCLKYKRIKLIVPLSDSSAIINNCSDLLLFEIGLEDPYGGGTGRNA